ncbi:MAG: ion transporter [Succinivibrionaceae bacterium]|nr:ion transporter [Succinivibrionaceae bacterium]
MGAQAVRAQVYCRALVTGRPWQLFIIALIVFNAAVLGIDTSSALTAGQHRLLSTLDELCLYVFTLEIALRLTAFRWRFFYARDFGWNWFDFLIVVGSYVSMELTVLRAFRILRVLKILSVVPSMRLISTAMLRTIPPMISIGALLMVFFYIFGVLCTNLFGQDFPEYFGSLQGSLFSLFQIMTGDSWASAIVRPVLAVYPYAWVIFVAFIILVTFIGINLVVGIIVEGINTAKSERARPASTASCLSRAPRARLREVAELLWRQRH